MSGAVTQTRASAQSWRLTALEPVWVSYTAAEKAKHAAELLAGKKQRGRVSEGPNGEAADSGKWRLQWPRAHARFAGQVYDGEILSVSALDTASECLNKFGMGRVHGLDEPENRKAALGNLRHDELERWEKYGTAPTTAGMAAVLSHFPAPGAESEVFFGFAIEQYDGNLAGEPMWKKPIVIGGWIDVRESAVEEHPRDGGYNGVVRTDTSTLNSVVYDLKTTGDFRWKKTPAQLRANIQAAAYALGEMLRVESVRGEGANGTDLVLLRWVYGQLKERTDKNTTPIEKAVCEIVRVELTDDDDGAAAASGLGSGGVWIERETALAVVAQYVPLAETLIDILERAKAERAALAASGAPTTGRLSIELPKNGDACWSYGGCPWKKIEVETSWEETVKVQKLVFDGGRERVVQIERKEKKKKVEKACTPPEGGGGFMSMHKQAQAKAAAKVSAETGEAVIPIGGQLGIAKAVEQWNAAGTNAGAKLTDEEMALVESALGGMKDEPKQSEQRPRSEVKVEQKRVEQQSAVNTKPKTVSAKSAKQETKMGLMNRFGSTVGAAAAVAAVPEAAKVVAPVAKVEAPVTQTAGTTPSGGLGARFANAGKGATAATTTATEKAPEVKAASDGMASGGAAGSSGGAAPAGQTLAQRLTAIKSTATVAAAVEKAPTTSVATGQQQLAVGINPADAAPELSQAEQVAEGERLAAKGQAAESGATIAEGAAKTDAAAAEAAKPKRGRPAGSTKAAAQTAQVAAAVEKAAESASEGNVVGVLALLAQAALEAGRRREATILLNACDAIEALNGAPASVNAAA